MSQSPGPVADTSVRLAWLSDADAIAHVQVASWRDRYATLVPAELLGALEPADFAEAWVESIGRPREARQRVLVALERASVRGFAAVAPSTDPDADPIADGEVREFAIDPRYRDLGHGSRLLHAVVDTLRSDTFARATIWLASSDDAVRAFLTDQGWAPDGAHRELDLTGDETTTVKQVRLHTDLTASES